MNETPSHLATVQPESQAPADALNRLRTNVQTVIRGKAEVVDLAITALLARGHLLIEDVPGVGKTTLAASLARSVGGTFSRVQFTNDLLPSDVIGVSVFDQQGGDFSFKRGPIFSNVVLADEINRATPRTQSCLLEAMNRHQVSVDGMTHQLEDPFLVIATQNPLEFYGTYPLPESQLDRFLMRINVGYPAPADEKEILTRTPFADPLDTLEPALSPTDVVELQRTCSLVRCEELVLDYLLELVASTRSHPHLALGVSPRGAQALLRAARARAIVDGRSYCLPDDVKNVFEPVCAHRVQTSSGRDEDSLEQASRVIQDVLERVPVPS